MALYSVESLIQHCYDASTRYNFSYNTVQGIYEIKDRTLIVTFRATDTDADWIRHFECGLSASHPPAGARIHIGWLGDYMQSWCEFIKSEPLLPSLIDRAIFVGHSYGGALASVGAYFFSEDGTPTSLVTFNAPRAGNRAFARELGKRVKSFHFVYGSDIIWRVPPWYGCYVGIVHIAPRPFYKAAYDSVRVLIKWAIARIKHKPIDLFDAIVAKDHLLDSFSSIAKQELDL